MPSEISSSDLDVDGLPSLFSLLIDGCEEVGASFFVIGALARDVHVRLSEGLSDAPRTTRDVDVAVAVENWDAYERLCAFLTEQHGFRQSPSVQRMRSKDGTIVDLVPFGGVADESGMMQFPSDGQSEMTVLGFDEVQNDVVLVRIDDEVTVSVVSLRGLVLLKLISWSDRRHQKDAQDLCFVMRHYFDDKADTEGDSLYLDHADLFDVSEFRKERASARLLGRDIAGLINGSPSLQTHVLDTLQRETKDANQSRLARVMDVAGCYPDYTLRFESLVALLNGIKERLPG